MHPSIAFTEALCKRASADGWKLQLSQIGFAWQHGQTIHRHTAINPDLRVQLFTACVALDEAVYHLQVELN
jgi:hypothetical protein